MKTIARMQLPFYGKDSGFEEDAPQLNDVTQKGYTAVGNKIFHRKQCGSKTCEQS